jgi:hypothetical protein
MNENKVDEEIFEMGVSADGPKSYRIRRGWLILTETPYANIIAH